MPPSTSAEGFNDPVGIILQNTSSVHATDIEIVLCEYDDVNDETTRKSARTTTKSASSCAVVGALLAPDDTEDAKEIEELYLLYPVAAGKGVYVVVDPMNEIVESDEGDNVKPIPEPLESNSPVLDAARKWSERPPCPLP